MLRVLAAVTMLAAFSPSEPARWQALTITESQTATSHRVDERAVPLARILVSETGFVRGHDDAAIFAVLEHRARRMHVPLLQAMRRYSSRVFDRRRTDHRRWLAFLDGDERPHGWPRGTRWRPDAWADAVRTAEALLRGELKHGCSAWPEHWGARSLDRTRDRWRRVDCGPTQNVFWRLPMR